MKTEIDVVYDSEHDLKLDYYLPDQPIGLVILVHGGGWFRGDKTSVKDLALRLNKDGFAVVAPNYRLADVALFPGALNDIDQVYTWVKNQTEFQGLEISALGGSAGGNLSIELALKYGIKAASWSGIIDLFDWVSQHPDVVAKNNQDQKVNDAKLIDQDGQNDSFYKWFILNYVADNMELLRQADPLQRVTAESGELFLANSTNEFVPVSGVFKLAEKYASLNKFVTLQLIPGSKHATGYEDDVYDQTLLFLKKKF